MADIEIPAVVEIGGEFKNINEWSVDELQRAARDTDSISERRGIQAAIKLRELERRLAAADPAALDDAQAYLRSLPTDVLAQLRDRG